MKQKGIDCDAKTAKGKNKKYKKNEPPAGTISTGGSINFFFIFLLVLMGKGNGLNFAKTSRNENNHHPLGCNYTKCNTTHVLRAD